MEWQPIETAQVRLTQGQFAIIDASDLPLIAGMSWSAQKRSDGVGYYAVSSNGTRMHRLLMAALKGQIVDHKDGDGLNNRRANLRIGTQSGNSVNRRKTPGTYLRGARPKKGKWQAYIKANGRQRSLGYYNTEQEAHNAYVAEAARIYGDWMPLLNPPAT